MRTNHITTREHPWLSVDNIVAICGYCALAVVEYFQSRKIYSLTNRRHDQVSLDVIFTAFHIFDLELRTNKLCFALGYTQCSSSTTRITHNSYRYQTSVNMDT